IYTEGRFRVSDLILNTTSSAIRDGVEITYLMPGGSVVIDGRRVIATYPFPVVRAQANHRYLVIFGSRLASTGAFVGQNGAWDVSADIPVALRPDDLKRETPSTTAELLTWVRQASTSPTSEGGCKAGG